MSTSGSRGRRALRATAAWGPVLVAVPLVMAGTVAVSLPDDDRGPIAAIAPMEVGTTWVYAVSDHGRPSGTLTKQVTGQAALDADAFDAVTLASAYTDYPGMGETGNTVYLKLTDSALEQRGVWSGHEHLAVDPPAAAYALPLEEGASWDYEGLVGTSGLRFEAEVTAVEDVEVGGRTFTDCVHVVTTLAWRSSEDEPWSPDTTQEEWACPGFGPVRTVERDPANDVEITAELVEFHSEEVDWFAEAPEAPRVEPTPGATVGLDAGRSNAVAGTLSDQLAWSDLRSARFDFPPVGDAETMVLAERDGEVSAMDQQTGAMRWRVRLSGPIVTTPAVAGDRVLVADSRKNLWALALDDGRALWVHRFGDVVSASPAVAGDRVVVASEDRRVAALDLADGRALWSDTRSSVAQTAPALAGDRVLVADQGGAVTAYALIDGEAVWERDLEGGLLAGPAVSGDRAVLGDETGVIYGLDLHDGELAWEQRTVHYPSTPFAVGGDTVLSVGDDRRLEAFDLTDGEERWHADVDRTLTAPVVVGDELVTVTDAGELTVRDLGDGEVRRSWGLPRPVDRADSSVHMPIGLVGGVLVTGVDYGEEGLGSGLYAYPLDATSVEGAGVWWRTELRDAVDGVGGPATLAGDTLVMSGYEQAVHRVSPANAVTTLFAADGLVPGVVATDEVILAQKDTELRAYPVDGDEPRWTYDTVAGYPGQVPAVDGDTVFVPRNQEGLAAVSLEDGTERWRIPLQLAFGAGQPLALPDGDVVYGGAALSRYERATGRQLWSIYDGVVLGPMAHADGLVHADVVRALGASGLGAYDAGTGEEVWFHEHDNQQIGIGPAVGDGVVVAADSQGLVAAFDAATGDELWRLRLRTAIGGQPWIHNGVAYVAEAGRKEDLYQRDYRISAHDVRTGRYLGSFQPPGSMFTLTPSVWPSGDALLAPGSFTRAVVTIVRPQR